MSSNSNEPPDAGDAGRSNFLPSIPTSFGPAQIFQLGAICGSDAFMTHSRWQRVKLRVGDYRLR
jgi:hypothetical protein